MDTRRPPRSQRGRHRSPRSSHRDEVVPATDKAPDRGPEPASLVHSAASAHIAARLERDGHPVLSEYEIAARERAERKRIYSAQTREGRHHRPDLVVLGDSPEAIEVELSDKSNRRLDGILRGWRWAILEKRFGRVRYLCSPRAMPYVTRAVHRMPKSDGMEVERLEERHGCWVLAGPRSPFVRL